MSEKRRFLKHTFIFGVGGVLAQITPLVLLPLYTNYLAPSDYGALNLIFSTSDIINTVFLVGGICLAAMTFYKQAESEEARRRIAITLSILVWFFVALAIAVSLYFVEHIDRLLKIGNTNIVAFGLATALLEAFVSVPMTLMQARLESIRFVLVNVIQSLARLGLCIYFVAGLQWGIWGVFIAQASVLGVFIVCLTYRELRIGSIYPDTAKWKEVLKFALPLVPNGMLAFLYSASTWFFLLHYSPYEGIQASVAVGLYMLASRLVSMSNYMGPAPLQQVWRAEMYDIFKRPDAAYVFGNFLFRLFCLKTFAVLLISTFALELLRAMSKPSYHEVALYVPLYGVSAIFTLLASQMTNTFYITRKTNYNFFCTALSLPCNLLLMYLLVPRWGLMGTAWAWLLSQIIYAGIIYIISRRIFVVHYPFGKMAAFLAVTFLCYGLTLLCGNGIALSSMSVEQFAELSRGEKIFDAWNRIQWLSLFAKMSVLCLCGIVIWFSGILYPEDKAAALRFINKMWRKVMPLKKETN